MSSLILKLKQIIFDNWYIIFLTLTSVECFHFKKPGREKKLHTIQVTYFHFYIHRLIDTKLSFFSKSAVLNPVKNFQYFKKLQVLPLSCCLYYSIYLRWPCKEKWIKVIHMNRSMHPAKTYNMLNKCFLFGYCLSYSIYLV